MRWDEYFRKRSIYSTISGVIVLFSGSLPAPSFRYVPVKPPPSLFAPDGKIYCCAVVWTHTPVNRYNLHLLYQSRNLHEASCPVSPAAPAYRLHRH